MTHDPHAKSRIEAQLVARPRAAQTVAPVFSDIAAEARLQAVRAAGAVPASCGDAIPVAPARGPVKVFTPREMAITEAGNVRAVRTGWMGRDGLCRGDAFDVMEDQAARRARARNRPHRPLFTAAQVASARTYAALAERHGARGVRCSSIETGARGSGDGCYMTTVIREGERLDAMRAAIGDGWALEARRVSQEGRRRPIRVLAMVDLVCLGGLTLSDVLGRHGWARSTTYRVTLRSALAAALDRIYGL